ncbi:MAG: L-rhamnose mutarotase [Coriobacteriia bacterium]|nr:L-rhamnose mutarotase [Coriobacteriia bacterium]
MAEENPRRTADGYVIEGFKMKLFPGFKEEYERRHNELWPEMADMLHEYGARNYSIFIDPDSDTLFGYIEVKDPAHYDTSAQTEVCKRWWHFMASVMETNPDESPVSTDLHCAFHLD